MDDEERIQMYYKFGFLDWENEEKLREPNYLSIFDLFKAKSKKFFIRFH